MLSSSPSFNRFLKRKKKGIPPISAGGVIKRIASQSRPINHSINIPPNYQNAKNIKIYKNAKVRPTSAAICNKDENSVVRYIVKIQKWKGDDTS